MIQYKNSSIPAHLRKYVCKDINLVLSQLIFAHTCAWIQLRIKSKVLQSWAKTYWLWIWLLCCRFHARICLQTWFFWIAHQ